MQGDELLFLDHDAALRIKIQEISSPFLIWKTLHKRHKGLKERKIMSFNIFFDSEA